MFFCGRVFVYASSATFWTGDKVCVVLFGVVALLHLFVVLYHFSPFVCFILMVEFYNIFGD
jgi:hypothetical protein